MTKEQIALVKKTWGIFRNIDPVLIGDVFYSKLFLDMPHLKNLFHTAKAEQSKKLIEMLTFIVGRLDNTNEFKKEIKELATRHVQYGVKAHHYKSVESALLWTLHEGLGIDWNAEVKEAWTVCLQLLSRTMINDSGYIKRTT